MHSHLTRGIRAGLHCISLLAAVGAGGWGTTAHATTWQAASAGYWTNSANWTAGVPGAGDDANFDATGVGNAIIDSDVTVQNLTLGSGYTGKLTFPAGMAANITVNTDLAVGSAGTIEITYVSTNGQGAGRTITVGGNATITGTISADAGGFPSYGDGSTLYHGPGYDGDGYWGAAHGGRSGLRRAVPYGSIAQPTALGSGAYGSRGGGAIKLDVAGTLTVNGRISADGPSSFHSGAGGSVWLICNALAGTGTVSATSGDATAGWGGGGGRIAIYAASRTFTGHTRAAGATGSNGQPGQPGSLWDTNRFTTTGQFTINADRYQYFFPAGTPASTWGLALTNGAMVYFHDFTNSLLSFTSLQVSAASTLRFDVDASGVETRVGINNLAISNAQATVSILSTSTVYLPSQAYTLGALTISTGSALIAGHGNTNAVNADSGGSAGTPHGSGMAINCDSATIDGRLDTSATGFRATTGPGKATVTWDGGSHGGRGGGSGAPPSGLTYGKLTRPTALGSGARYDTAEQHFGGGAIRLRVAGTLSINGSVRADGGYHDVYGGDSGGSIWVIAGTLTGSGLITAGGGHGNLGSNHGAGGGGRIAVDYVDNSGFSGTIAASNGVALSSTYPSRTGTVFLCQSPVLGAGSEGSGGTYLQTELSVTENTNGVKLLRTMTTFNSADLQWTDQSVRWSDGLQLDNIATYTAAGLIPGIKWDVYDNSALLFQTNSGSGFFAFSINLTNGAHTVKLHGNLPAGTMISVR